MSVNESRVLCHDKEAEIQVIGAFFYNNSYFYEAKDKGLTADMFYHPKHQKIFNAVDAIVSENKVADLISVAEYFNTHPSPDHYNPEAWEIAEIASTCIAPYMSFMQHLYRVQDLWQRRQLWVLGCSLINAGTDESIDLDEIKAKMQDVGQQVEQGGITSLSEELANLRTLIDSNRAGGVTQCLYTDFRLFDTRGGLHTSDLVIVAADTSQGKSTLAISLTVNMALRGTPCIIYSMEMQARQLAARILASRTGISSTTLLYAQIGQEQYSHVQEQAQKIQSLPIYFDDRSTSTIEKIISSIRIYVKKKQIKVAVIDYIQILGTIQSVRNLEQFYGDVSRKLKNLAKELDICIIALSQLNRDKDNPEPSLARLRASGQIAEAADTVVLIYRPEVYGKAYKHSKADPKGTALLTIAKGRNIGTGSEIVGFNADGTYFYDINGNIPIRENAPAAPPPDDDTPF